jgi:hypothetical protein
MCKEETSNAGNNVLIPMWEVAIHDWSTYEPRLHKRKTTKARGD